MAFLQEELRNFSFKGWSGILGTGNRSTAPDNLAVYEEMTTNSVYINPSQIITKMDDIPPAPTQSDASANASANPLLIFEHDVNHAIHLTPSPNNKAFFATETYGDLTTRLYNFIMPQAIPRTDAGNEGRASIGYTARLYQGNPASGGTEITTTVDQDGADVGWFFMYGAGAVVVASSFTGITDPTDVWITGFRYVGPTGTEAASADVNVDDITVETIPGYQARANTGNTRQEIIDTYWMHGVPVGSSVGWRGAIAADGALQMVPNDKFIFAWNDDDTMDLVWDSGTYSFYSTINIDALGVHITDSDNNKYYFASGVKENNYYRYSVNLPAARYYYFTTDDTVNKPYTIYLIDRYDTEIEDEITIKNINTIIDGNMISIDGSFIDAKDPHTELVTRSFVESRISESDEVTIESKFNDIEIVDTNDIQYLLHDAWDDTLPTTDWELDPSASLSNGIITINAQSNTSIAVITHSTGALATKSNRVKIITNYDFDTENAYIELYDDFSGIYSVHYEKEVLLNGEFVFTISLPANYVIQKLQFSIGDGADQQVYLKFADMDKYPPVSVISIKEIDHIIDDDFQSIDGSDTPMSDPHRELVTRAYIDTKTTGYSQTFTQADLVDGVLRVEHNINAKDEIVSVTIRNDNNKIIDPDDINIINADIVEVDLGSAEPIDGTWAILISGITDEIIVEQENVSYINGAPLNTKTLN